MARRSTLFSKFSAREDLRRHINECRICAAASDYFCPFGDRFLRKAILEAFPFLKSLGRPSSLLAPTSARSASSAVETAIAAAAADISASIHSGKAGDTEWRQIITRVVDLVLKQ